MVTLLRRHKWGTVKWTLQIASANLGDMVSAGGTFMTSCIVRCRATWGQFPELLQLLTACDWPFKVKACCTTRTWVVPFYTQWKESSATLLQLCCNDCAMIHLICGVIDSSHQITPTSMDILHAKFAISDLTVVVRESRLGWLYSLIILVRNRTIVGKRALGGQNV